MAKVFDFMDKDRQEFLRIKHEEAQRFIDPDTGKIHAHMVERINCPVCDVDDSVWVFDKAGFDFVRCRHCGLLYVNPQLTAEIQDSIYKQSKTADHWIKVQKKTKEQTWNAEKKYLPALEELRRIYPQGGKLLDVGCSIGQFLSLARDAGWDVMGVELNADAAAIARRDYSLTIHEKKLEEAGFAGGEFDVVTLWGVLEHLTDPNGMLQTIRRVLKNDGLVLFFVPNGHSLIIRMTREHNSTVSGRAHLWYFTPETMDKILRKSGFKKVVEFSVLPQLHEIEHFLQYNTLYREPDVECAEEFTIPTEVREALERYMDKNKLGYKLITIGRKIG
ncbi:MAG: class I SAM-dependent methyltransferase [Desulfovibrionales bacterium]|nr:class I SAM-dependent methyltransferase [Desulfovibrionales bacterium]